MGNGRKSRHNYERQRAAENFFSGRTSEREYHKHMDMSDRGERDERGWLAETLGAIFANKGAKNLYRGLGTLVTAPFHIAGDLLHSTGYGARVPLAKTKRLLRKHAEEGEDMVTIPREDLQALLEREPRSQRRKLLRLISRSPDEESIRVDPDDLADFMEHIYQGQGRSRKKMKPLEVHIQEAAAILLLVTSIFFLDKASITGYAVSAATGTSLAGYYSLLGFVFLGVAVLIFVYSERTR